MADNKTSQLAQDYDNNIEKTLPRYSQFHDETLNLAENVNPSPKRWLDTGCGTGLLVAKAAKHFLATHFVLADPSEAMLDIAKGKFAQEKNAKLTFVAAGTEDINYPEESFDIISAILSHHYFNVDTRMKATANCFKMLKKGGVYITFESIMPNTEGGLRIGLERWRAAQLKNGKSAEAVERHINRFGIEFFPISIDDHISLLKQVGFSTFEILWVSGMQAGFYAIK